MFVAMATVSRTKKPVPQDWHRADIIAALWKAGTSLRQLSLEHEYHPRSLARALSRPWPRAEKLIAARLGLRPHAIWPTRYRADGTPKSGHGERGIGRPKTKDSRSAARLQGAVA